MKTARFWTFTRGCDIAKVSIRKGQTLQWGFASRHEEGWHSEAHEWSFDGEKVYREVWTDGTDCDGRMSHSYEDECEVKKLKNRQLDGEVEWIRDGVRFPEWKEVTHSQRDYAAEAMGY